MFLLVRLVDHQRDISHNYDDIQNKNNVMSLHTGYSLRPVFACISNARPQKSLQVQSCTNVGQVSFRHYNYLNTKKLSELLFNFMRNLLYFKVY